MNVVVKEEYEYFVGVVVVVQCYTRELFEAVGHIKE